MRGTFLIYLKQKIEEKKGTLDNPSEWDSKLIHRDPDKSNRYGIEFENIGGLNLWKHPYLYHTKARIRDSPQNIMFKKILERNITNQFTDNNNREVIEVSQHGAERALNQTVWLKYWNSKTGENKFHVVIVPHNVYALGMTKPMYNGYVTYNPKLVEVPTLIGSTELESIKWGQERLKPTEKTIRDVFKGL